MKENLLEYYRSLIRQFVTILSIKKTRDKSCNLRSVRCWSYLFSVRYRYDLQEMSLGVSTVRHLLFLENSFSFSRGTELARIKRKRKKGEDGTDRKSSSL